MKKRFRWTRKLKSIRTLLTAQGFEATVNTVTALTKQACMERGDLMSETAMTVASWIRDVEDVRDRLISEGVEVPK